MLGRCEYEDEAEFSEDTTDEEIQEHYLEWRHEHIDGGWEDIE